MQESCRLFIALAPPPSTRLALARLRDDLAPLVSGRPVPSSNLHLTLAFLGQVPQQRHPSLQQLVRNLPLQKGEIALDAVGAFPKAGVIWAGCNTPNPQLEKLVEDVREALLANKFTFDERPFRTHITLFRKAKPLRQIIEPPISWRLTTPQLYISLSTPHGVTYRIMQ